MSGVYVDRQHWVFPELVHRWGRGRRGLPGRVQVPALAIRLIADVVADCPSGGLGGHLVAPVGKGDRSGQPPAAMRPVCEVGERLGELDLHPALVRVEPDRLVAPPLVGLTIRADEQAGRLPPLLPLHRGDPDLIEVVPGPGKAPTTPADRHPPIIEPGFHPDKAGLQHLQAALLLVALTGTAIAPVPATPATDGHGQTPPYRVDPRPQGRRLGDQVSFGNAPGVLAGAGDRPRPARRTGRGQRLFALPTRGRTALGLNATLTAAPGQIRPCQAGEIAPERTQHRRILWRCHEPGAHPNP